MYSKELYFKLSFSMTKTKLFIDNFIIYGIGGTISKAIPVLMVPIVTRIMPSSVYYGLSDMSNTLVSIAGVMATLGIYDGLFRMYFETEDRNYRKAACSTALTFALICSMVVFFILVGFRKQLSIILFGSREYGYLVLISSVTVLVGSSNQIVAAPTRMQNRRRVFLAVNVASAIATYSIAIFLLLRGHYDTGLPFSALIVSLMIEIFYFVLNREWFGFRDFDLRVLRQMLIIAIPLVPNFLTYWVFNSCDRIMITNIMGLKYLGIYSIGAKLGHCSQLLYTAFAGGWSYFVFSTMHDRDQVKYNSKLFEVLAIVSLVSMAFLCVGSRWLYKLLFPKEYLDGFLVVPYLYLSPLLLMLFQMSSSQFAVVKKTWFGMISLAAGAIVNIMLNSIMIPKLGIEGAAIATLCGYSISLLICLIILSVNKWFVVSGRIKISFFSAICFLFAWRTWGIESYLIAFVFLLLFVMESGLLFRREILHVIRRTQSA